MEVTVFTEGFDKNKKIADIEGVCSFNVDNRREFEKFIRFVNSKIVKGEMINFDVNIIVEPSPIKEYLDINSTDTNVYIHNVQGI